MTSSAQDPSAQVNDALFNRTQFLIARNAESQRQRRSEKGSDDDASTNSSDSNDDDENETKIHSIKFLLRN